MAINQNHLFEELNGVKCGIVEKNVSPARVQFLKALLEVNGFEVVVVASPPPKAAAPKPAAPVAEGEVDPPPELVNEPTAPETFTVGVTDYTFNPVNAIFGRLLRTKDGHVVTKDFWEGRTEVSLDDKAYFSH